MNASAQSMPHSPVETPSRLNVGDLEEQCRLILRQARRVDGELISLLGLTSARRGEGVSTIAVHLALQAAQVRGEPVLLVDAQFAAPRLHAVFQRPLSPGLMEALHDPQSAGEHIQATAHENLMLLAASESERRPDSCEAARFDASRIEYLFAELQREYSLVIVDLPSTSESSETLALAAAVDGVLLVVEADVSSASDVRDAAELLRRGGARLVGAVMNKCRGRR